MVYDPEDIVTYYFVVYLNNIKGWTDKKELAKAYMEFHSCKDYTLKKMTCAWKKMVNILNENTNDEIKIQFLETRDPKNKHRTKLLAAPLTDTEAIFINDEIQYFGATKIDYTFLNSAIPYLKRKYQDALAGILLKDITRFVCSGNNVGDLDLLASIQFDQVKVLYRNFSDQF